MHGCFSQPGKPRATHKEGDASPAKDATKRAEGVCHAYADGRECTRMPNCPYRHGDSPEELARVAAVNAKGKAKGKGGVGAASA